MFRVAGLWVLCCCICAGVQAQSPFTFTAVRPDLTQVNYGSIAFADVDFDGDFDVVGSGNRANRPPFVPYSYVAVSGGDYLRGGSTPAHFFSERGIGEGLRFSRAQWLDYNRDGRLDALISGTAHSGAGFDRRPRIGQTVLFRNDGGSSFSSVNPGIRGLYGGSMEVADYDGDGDDDVFLSGFASVNQIESDLYQNHQGRFSAVASRFEPLALGDAGWVDFDGDGDLDLLHSGIGNSGRFYTKLYRNAGSGQFSEVNTNLPGLAFSTFDWGDFDNDGDPDLALSGALLDLENYLEPIIQIWRNNGGNLVLTDISLDGVLYGQVGWGDYDNDGRLDLMVIGAGDLGSARRGRIYRNEGGRLIGRVALPGLASASVAWGDYDGDLDLDMLMSGTNLSFNPLTKLYRNDGRSVNTAPSPPSGLRADVNGRTVTLLWEAGSDLQTPAQGLSYNIYVGTASGRDNIKRAYSSIPDGRRLRPDRGNAGQALLWHLQDLPVGDYYWSVQAVDQGLIGSEFAEAGTFSVTTSPGLATGTETEIDFETTLMAGYPNPFRIGSSVSVPFTLKESDWVEMTIYNVLGARVRHLFTAAKTTGRHTADWHGDDDRGQPVAPGTYFMRMKVAETYHTQPIVLTR